MKSILKKTPPSFCLPNQDNKTVCLKDFKGTWILVYFYPKDNTPGCTTEACGIRDAWSDFSAHNAVVLGISADSPKSHQKFREKHHLSFDLLSDESKETIKAYASYKPKKMFGKEFIGIVRNSFLISPEYTVVKIYEHVSPNSHAQEVLNDIASLSR